MSEQEGLDPRFMELASRFLDGVATEEELQSLDGLVRNDPHALDTLAELLNQHGTLAWTQRGRASFKGGSALLTPSWTGEVLERAPRRAWWIAIPLAACLLLTVAIIRYAPIGILSAPATRPPPPPAKAPDGLTLSFQDGVLPSPEYRGTRNCRLMDKESPERRSSEPLLEVEASGEPGGRPSLLQWDLREIPPGSGLVSVSLVLTVTSVSRDREYEAYALSRPWIERQVNWFEYSSGRRWEVPGGRGSLDRSPAVLARFRPARGVVTVPLNEAGVTAVQRWVNSPESNHGLLLQLSDRSGEFTFHSRESSTASYRPKLSLSYHPPPK